MSVQRLVLEGGIKHKRAPSRISGNPAGSLPNADAVDLHLAVSAAHNDAPSILYVVFRNISSTSQYRVSKINLASA